MKIILLVIVLSCASLRVSADGRLVALGDFHGDFYHACLALHLAGAMNPEGEWIGGTDTVLQLGDIMNKGPYGRYLIDLLQNLTSQAFAAGGRFIELLGNHDLNNLRGDANKILPEELASYGGEAQMSAAFAHGAKYGDYFRNLSAFYTTRGILFVHGGVPPEFASLGVEGMNSLVKKDVDADLWNDSIVADPGEGPIVGHVQAKSVRDENNCTTVAESLKILGLQRIVVAHTALKEPSQISFFCNNTWIMIDTMISRWQEGMKYPYRGTISALEMGPTGSDVPKALYMPVPEGFAFESRMDEDSAQYHLPEHPATMAMWAPLMVRYGVMNATAIPPSSNGSSHQTLMILGAICGVVLLGVGGVGMWVMMNRPYRSVPGTNPQEEGGMGDGDIELAMVPMSHPEEPTGPTF